MSAFGLEIAIPDNFRNRFQIGQCCLGPGRKAPMLARVPVALRRTRIRAAVHPASPLPFDGRGLALLARAGPG